MKEVLNNPFLKILLASILAGMLVAPFYNYPACNKAVDNLVLVVYIIVALYIFLKEVISLLINIIKNKKK